MSTNLPEASSTAAASLGAALAAGVAVLAKAGVENPRQDARLLLAMALGVEPAVVLGYPERRLPADAAARYEDYLRRRAKREPLSRIRGTREFWSLEFALGPGSLDPRPDSEILVRALLDKAEPRRPLRILDLGTGSGCLLLSLLWELPKASGLGIDCSAQALETAVSNAQGLGLADRARFQQGDWAAGLSGPWDLIVANPPYIPSAELERLEPEVRCYDPRAALDGGSDGLQAYREIVASLPGLLAPGGYFALEIGCDQEAEVTRLLRQGGLADFECLRDIGGRPRCLRGRAA
jgi:release factor glutamine methyltransferase